MITTRPSLGFNLPLIWLALCRGMSYLFVLLIPFSVFWPVAKPFVPGILPLYVTAGIYWSDVALLFLLLALFVQRRYLKWGANEISWPLLAIVILAFLTAPMALTPSLAAYTAFRWAVALGVYLWFAQGQVPLPRLVGWFIGGLMLHVAVGLVQVLLQQPLGVLGELAIPANAQFASVVSLSTGPWLRAYGLTFHPNVLAGYLTVGLLLAMPLLTRHLYRWAWWVMWLGLFITFSRSAWISAALTIPVVAVWLFLRQPTQRRSLLSALGGAAVVLILCSLIWQEQLVVRLEPITKRFDQMSRQEVQRAIGVLQPTTTSTSLASATSTQAPPTHTATNTVVATNTPQPSNTPAMTNTPAATKTAIAALTPTITPTAVIAKNNKPNSAELWSWHWRDQVVSVAISVINERPWFGVGAGNSVRIMPYNFSPTHQVPLLLVSEIGILAGGLWLSLCFMMCLYLYRVWPRKNSWAVVMVCAWLALAVIGLFDYYPWGLNTGRLLTVMVSGLIGSLVENAS